MKTPHALADSRNQPIGEFDLQIPSDNSWQSYGALALTSTSINLPANQWVVLTVTGGVQLQISSLCSNYPGCPATATHSGQTIDALGLWPSLLQVKISGAGYNNIPLYYDPQNVPTALVWSGSGGVLSASRGGDQDGVGCYAPWPDPNTGITGCPPPNGRDSWFFAYAYTMSGTQTLKAALVDPLVVHGTPTTIHPGESVTFTASLVGSIYQNGNTWTWVAGEVGNQQQDQITTDPPSGGVRVGCNASPCVYAPTQSGRMYVQSTDYYGHPMRGSSEYIAINSGKFRVTANPSSVTLGGGIVASRVRASIRADDSGSGSTVTFQASTTDNSSFTIQSWNFQPDTASFGASTPCAPAVNPCIFNVEHAGTMFVTATISGNQELATAHVTVLCPSVGDSILDNPGIVDSLKAAYTASNMNAPVGTGQRREIGGGIYRRQDGTYLTAVIFDPNATECTYNPNIVPPRGPGKDSAAILVAVYHTHPSDPNEKVFGCPPNGKEKYAQNLGDMPHLQPQTAAPDWSSGGGSTFDWDWTRTEQIPDYVVAKSGRIWRLDPTTTEDEQADNPNKFDFLHAIPGCVKKA